MKKYLLLFIIPFIFSCKKDDVTAPITEVCVPDNSLYYSDYFVFIADDSGTPLVIPMDINWTPNECGYLSEYKGWYGTTEEWPIAYDLKDSIANLCAIPQESWEHDNTEYFQFNASTRAVIATIWGAPELRITIPESDNWVRTPAAEEKEIYGCKTSATVDGNIRTGWLIYERIRVTEEITNFGDFEDFFWIPIIVDNVFYHFEQHRGEQAVTKWESIGEEVTVSTLASFELNIDSTSADAISGRTNIPEIVTVKAPEWGLDIQLASGGSQVGHGPMFPNGLAYYRQSLLQSTASSENSGYGMLELILEDD